MQEILGIRREYAACCLRVVRSRMRQHGYLRRRAECRWPRVQAAGAAHVIRTAAVCIIARAGLGTGRQRLEARSCGTQQEQAHHEEEHGTTHIAASLADPAPRNRWAARARGGSHSVDDEYPFERQVGRLESVPEGADVARFVMVTLPVSPGAMVPTSAISGQSPLPISGADSGRCGAVSRLMNLTVTGWSRWLSTGLTPADVIVTVGSVRGCEGSKSAEFGDVTVRTVFEVHAARHAPKANANTERRSARSLMLGCEWYVRRYG